MAEFTLTLLIIALGILLVALIIIAIGMFLDSLGFFHWADRMVKAPFRAMGRTIDNVKEFVSMFYSENCPPIVIVDEETALIEEDN